jgi:AraC family transcriptional regulator
MSRFSCRLAAIIVIVAASSAYDLTFLGYVRTVQEFPVTLQSSPSANAVSPRIGLRIDVRTTMPGRIELGRTSEHRLKIHAGAPVRGKCEAHTFVYRRGDLDIHPAGYRDIWEEFDVNESIVLGLPPSLLQRAADDMGLDPAHIGLEPRFQFHDPQIEHVAWALEAEHKNGAPNGGLYTECLGLALAVHLLGRYKSSIALKRGLSRIQLRRVTAYIENNIEQDLSLATLAQIAHLSASHFKTLFKRSTGFAVHEYVIRRRVDRAKQLLTRSDLAASQVAAEAGFSHQSHMARAMRRVLGVTPRMIARSSREIDGDVLDV